MTRDEFWVRRFEMLVGTRAERAERADEELALYDKRFPLPTLVAVMDRATDQEIGKLRALVLRGAPLMERLRQWVECEWCNETTSPPHHQDCVDARRWLADCRAEGLE